MTNEQTNAPTAPVAVKVDPKALGIGNPGKFYDKN